MKHIVYIGIGSNLGDRLKNCQEAVAKISKHPQIHVTKISSWIETDPVGYKNQNKFINGAIEVETSLSPQSLLATLLSIENQMGRVRTIKWGPRIIDLDILIYGSEAIKTSDLVIPHPQIKRRPFIKSSLLELNPRLIKDEAKNPQKKSLTL